MLNSTVVLAICMHALACVSCVLQVTERQQQLQKQLMSAYLSPAAWSACPRAQAAVDAAIKQLQQLKLDLETITKVSEALKCCH